MTSAHDSLRSAAVLFERTDRRWLAFDGAKAADAITGLVTNDVLKLGVGDGQYAATLTPKGKMLADLCILRTGETSFVTGADDVAFDHWLGVVKKFVNPRLAKYAERSAVRTFAVHGPSAAAAIAESLATAGIHAPDVTASRLAGLAPWAHVAVRVDDDTLLLVASPALGDAAGFDLVLPDTLAGSVRDALLAHAHVVEGDDATWEIARIEAGRPAYPRDMNDTTIPQEANLGELGALSFEKGCYTGQETVARVHFRGHVNRHLRGLRAEAPLPTGAEVVTAEGKVVGDVRSTAESPRLGAIAIAMVRREVEPGTTVFVRVPAEAPSPATDDGGADLATDGPTGDGEPRASLQATVTSLPIRS